MNYISTIPFDVLKIDKSFIDEIGTDPTKSALVKTIIQLSHSMGAKVVAEGVETQEQLKLLENMECDIIQGYLFSKPLSSHDLIEFVNSNSAWNNG
ncbi:EAL domain-containing protein [Paenibacillus sp.]|uniref:EAL domain-containing protein n=1 Tax=Paenibacillus sp. TaxID=58172 RepID=UPI0028A80E3F|nr:EAL domain-containing protein [Paenibacillus sp.]